jgi:hypothetical protein
MNDQETLSVERGADSVQRPCSASYPLFKHMSDTYQLTLIEDELQEIIAKADESRMKANGRADMVRWALVNALYHLDTEQLHELGEAIAKRSGGTYTPNAPGERPGATTKKETNEN